MNNLFLHILTPPSSKSIERYGHLGIAGLVVWYLASGAQGARIDTWPGHTRLGLD